MAATRLRRFLRPITPLRPDGPPAPGGGGATSPAFERAGDGSKSSPSSDTWSSRRGFFRSEGTPHSPCWVSSASRQSGWPPTLLGSAAKSPCSDRQIGSRPAEPGPASQSPCLSQPQLRRLRPPLKRPALAPVRLSRNRPPPLRRLLHRPQPARRPLRPQRDRLLRARQGRRRLHRHLRQHRPRRRLRRRRLHQHSTTAGRPQTRGTTTSAPRTQGNTFTAPTGVSAATSTAFRTSGGARTATWPNVRTAPTVIPAGCRARARTTAAFSDLCGHRRAGRGGDSWT